MVAIHGGNDTKFVCITPRGMSLSDLVMPIIDGLKEGTQPLSTTF